jgi:uncharacterized membrane protein
MTQEDTGAQVRQAAWMALLLARPRLWIAFAGGLAVGMGCHWLGGFYPSTSVILGWDATCLTYIALMMHNIAKRSPEEMRERAARDDQSRGVILVIVLVAAVASVVAVGLELSLAKKASDLERTVRVALAFVTVASSWFMVHLMFALHYAHGYYDCDAVALADVGGLKFPGDEPPDYWDFLHFSLIIGVASQTADIAITAKALRRLSTVHSLFAFAFNTVIVALTINLLAGLFA